VAPRLEVVGPQVRARIAAPAAPAVLVAPAVLRVLRVTAVPVRPGETVAIVVTEAIGMIADRARR